MDILSEISDIKANLQAPPLQQQQHPASKSFPVKTTNGYYPNTQQQQQQQQPFGVKLYSYENRLHQAVMMKSHHNQHQQQQLTHNSPTTPTIQVQGQTIVESTQPQPNSSSSSSSRYSSQVTLNVGANNNGTNTQRIENELAADLADVELNGNHMSGEKVRHLSKNKINYKCNYLFIFKSKLEFELQMLRQRLKETELSLKKEQTEKYLLEFKLKQQQQENDQQMRSIINR